MHVRTSSHRSGTLNLDGQAASHAPLTERGGLAMPVEGGEGSTTVVLVPGVAESTSVESVE